MRSPHPLGLANHVIVALGLVLARIRVNHVTQFLRVRVRVRVRVDLVNCKVVIDYFFGVKLKILLRVSSYLAIFRQEY